MADQVRPGGAISILLLAVHMGGIGCGNDIDINAGQVHPRPRHQSGQPRHEILRLEDHAHRASRNDVLNGQRTPQ
jgi:hypothetical protein